MTSAADVTVALALREPRALLGASIPQWELLIRQARGTNLLARLGEALDGLGLLPEVPAAPRAHLDRGAIARARASDAVRREVALYRARRSPPRGVPIVLLKGAAYLLAGLRSAHGRIFSDIDILVPQARLAEVEAALMLQGWATTKHPRTTNVTTGIGCTSCRRCNTWRGGRCSTSTTRSCP